MQNSTRKLKKSEIQLFNRENNLAIFDEKIELRERCKKNGAKKQDVVSKDLKRKQVSEKCSKGSESNTPSAPKKPKKATSTPQQNSNSRSA